MSYHNAPYQIDYLKIYPCLKERPDVLEVLKKSDRKMKYMEVDLKSEQRRKNAENGAESYVPSSALNALLRRSSSSTSWSRILHKSSSAKHIRHFSCQTFGKSTPPLKSAM